MTDPNRFRLYEPGLRPGRKRARLDEPESLRRRGRRPRGTASSATAITKERASRTPRSSPWGAPPASPAGRRSTSPSSPASIGAGPRPAWMPSSPAGLRRIVVSALDPNPLVCGPRNRPDPRRGPAGHHRRPRRAPRAASTKRTTKYIRRKIPFITLKAAVSLDGRMATRAGDSRWISTAASRDYVHLVRGEQDAILVGIATALRDDPRLTVRHPNWPGKRITRVILDPGLRLPPSAGIFSTRENGPIMVFAGPAGPEKAAEALARRGADVVRVPASGDRLDLHRVLAELGRREISSVLVEGGGTDRHAFLEGRLADKILLAVSPRLIGGTKAIPLFGGEGPARLADVRSDSAAFPRSASEATSSWKDISDVHRHHHPFGRVRGYRPAGEMELGVRAAGIADKVGPGDSVAVDGVCLTVIRKDGGTLVFNLSRETPGSDDPRRAPPGHPAQPRASADPGRASRRPSGHGPHRFHGQARPLRSSPAGPPPRVHSPSGRYGRSSSPKARSPSTGSA